MRIGSTLLLLAASLSGQGARPVAPEAATPQLKLQATQLSPQAMLKAMVALDRASRNQSGATVEVIGYDDKAILRLLSLRIQGQVRLEFHPMDKRGHQELYALMHQDPSRPGPPLFVPVMAGGKVSRSDDKWFR